MDVMHNKKSLLTTIPISVSIFCVIFAVSMFAHLKSVEERLKQEKKTLIEQNIELKNQYDSARAALTVKTDALENLEAERNAVAEEIARIKRQAADSASRTTEELELLRKENRSLRDELALVKKLSVTQVMREAVAGEDNETVRRIIEDALRKIEMAREGKSVTLEPIVVTESGASYEVVSPAAPGKILSVDTKSNLIAIDLGRGDDLREGQRCYIMKDGEEIGSAEIIRVRSKISAAFVDEMNYKYTVRDIRVGDRVSVQQ